jgi:hypothetical protein
VPLKINKQQKAHKFVGESIFELTATEEDLHAWISPDRESEKKRRDRVGSHQP